MNLNLVQATMVISQVHIYTEFFFTINDYLTRIRRINFCFTWRSQVFNCWSLIDCKWLRNWSATCSIIVNNRCCTICLNFNISDTVSCLIILSIDGILNSSLFLFGQAVFICNSCQFRVCHWKTILELPLNNTKPRALCSIPARIDSCNYTRISLTVPICCIIIYFSSDSYSRIIIWRKCSNILYRSASEVFIILKEVV